MALGINTNIASLNAQRNLISNQAQLGQAVQRLSSGLRINSAKDDAAGIAIAERFTTQINGSNQAARNANDGISMLQTADGNLASITQNLQRIRQLAVQASNSTTSYSDRQAIQSEVDQLKSEVDRIGAGAQFNGKAIFGQGRVSSVGNTSQLAVLDGLKSGWLEDSESMIQNLYGLKADGAAISIELTTFTDGVGGVAARVVSSAGATGFGTNLKLQIDMADFTPPNLPNGGSAPMYNDRIIAHEMVHAVMARSVNWGSLVNNNTWFVEGTAEFIHGADERVQADVAASSTGAVVAAINGATNTSAFYSASYSAVRYLHEQIKAAGGAGIKDIMTYMTQNPSATLDQALANASHGLYANVAAFKADFAANGATFIGGFNFANSDTGAIGGLDVDGGAVKTATSVVPDTASRTIDNVLQGFAANYETLATGGISNNLDFQVGANVGETISTQIGSINLDSMALQNSLDLVNMPSEAILSVDRALEYVGGQRAVIGAQMSRFESVISTLQTSSDNMTASRSRIQDADYAVETAALSRAQILQQAGTAMVAQANQMPRMVAALLR